MEMKPINCTIEDMLRGAEKIGVGWKGNSVLPEEVTINHAENHSESERGTVNNLDVKRQEHRSDRTPSREAGSKMQWSGTND